MDRRGGGAGRSLLTGASFFGTCSVANEQLQYYFNQHIFTAEQSIYQQEGLSLAAIAFNDNGPILDMIMGRSARVCPAGA
jgi:hypothetical protein